MDRSRRQGAKESAPPPPAASRLTLKPRRNRRRPGSLWSRVPRPSAIADACGRALRRSVPAIVGGAILAVLGGTAYAGYRFVTTSPRFAITQISVQGNHHRTAEQIRAELPIAPGENVFVADLDATTRALNADPWIARAEVHRVLPHTLVVDVGEHEPAALVDVGERYLVDASGHPFKHADDEEGAELPTVTGLERASYIANPDATAALVQEALAALASWRSAPARPAISELHLDGHGALALRTAEPAIEIDLGALDEGLAARMQTFDAVWAELGDAERARTRTIHLDPDHVTVAFKDL